MTYVVFTNGCIFVRCLNRSKITTFDVTYCFFPVVFVMCGTVKRSTRPVLDCGFKTNSAVQMHSTFHLTLKATIAYKLIFFTLATLFGRRVITVFVSHSCPTCSVTITKLPLFTSNFVFFTMGVISVNCFRDMRQTHPTVVIAILHKFIFVMLYLLNLPLLLGIPKV